MQTYSDNKYTYSVDMMFAYLHNYKNDKIKLEVSKLVPQMDYKGWGDPAKGIKYSPMEVLADPVAYPKDTVRIENANLSYPIIVSYDGNIIDGMHRLSKAYIDNIKYINAYQFSKKLMKKFIIGRNNDYDSIDRMKTYDFINLYVTRFC